MKPRFTDMHKFPHGYRKACETNIALTFERIRREQAKKETATVTQLRSAHGQKASRVMAGGKA